MTHLAIVWNPSKTSKEDLEAAYLKASASLDTPGEVSWWETSVEDAGQGPAARAVAAGATVVAAAGGDGTVRAVAEHLASSGADADLAIIPLGTGNLLARNLGVPLNRLPDAFTRALTSESRRIDFAWADLDVDGEQQKHGFAVMGGFGIDAHMITETDSDLKDKAGWLAYVESLGRAVTASDVIDIRIGVNGAEPEEDHAHTVMVGNCGTVQGGITLLPDADVADGQLDVVVLGAEGVGAWFDTLRNLVWDNGIRRQFAGGDEGAQSTDSVQHLQATEVVLELSEPRVFEIDGEDLGETTRVVISIQPAALTVR